MTTDRHELLRGILNTRHMVKLLAKEVAYAEKFSEVRALVDEMAELIERERSWCSEYTKELMDEIDEEERKFMEES